MLWRNSQLFRASLFLLTVIQIQPVLADLSITQAEQSALTNDSVLKALAAQVSAMRDLAIAEDTLPDARYKLGVMNVPTDSYDLRQEPMTQIQFGIQQMFPPGNSLELKSKIKNSQADAMHAMLTNRQRMVRRDVRIAWLDTFYWKQAEKVVQGNRKLFSDLVQVTQSQYATGRHQQQDVMHAELELGRLDDRLLNIRSMLAMSQASLTKWLGSDLNEELPDAFPALPPLSNLDQMLTMLPEHPMMQSEQAQVKASQQGVELARQAYKPSWMLDLTYGKREPTLLGVKRSDFASVMLMFDLPFMMAGDRQDRRVAASRYKQQASLSERDERLRELKRMFTGTYATWQQLNQRVKHYDDYLLPKSRENARAAMQSYQSGRGNFNSLVRARIAELETKLQGLRVKVDHHQAQANLLYLTGAEQ